MALEGLFDILKRQTRFPGFTKRLEEAEALGRWEQAVGEIIAKHSRAVRVEADALYVEVDHPIWRSELHHRKRQILEILNGATAARGQMLPAPKQILKDIVFIDPRRTR